MMRQILMFAAALILSAGLWTAAPVAADEGCYEAEFTYTNTSGSEQRLFATPFDEGQQKFIGPSVEFTTLKAGAEFDGNVQVDVESGSIDLILFSTAPSNGRENVAVVRASQIGQANPRRCNVFTDGRLNSGDAAAPIVVYRDGDVFAFWSVSSAGAGSQVLSVPLTDIQPAVATAVQTGANQTIVEQGGLGVYALSVGTCQVNVFLPGGGLYTFEWNCNVAPGGTDATTSITPTSPATTTVPTTPAPVPPGVDSFTFPPLD